MTRCSSCDYKWKAKKVWSLGFSKDGKDCLNCGNRQFISRSTQRMFTLGFISMVFVFVFPFFIKLSSKDKSLW